MKIANTVDCIYPVKDFYPLEILWILKAKIVMNCKPLQC